MSRLNYKSEINIWLVLTVILFIAFIGLAVIHLTDLPNVDYSVKDNSFLVLLDKDCQPKEVQPLLSQENWIQQDYNYSLCPLGTDFVEVDCNNCVGNVCPMNLCFECRERVGEQ